MADELSIRVADPAEIETLENALAAVEAELDVEVNDSPGRPGPGEISKPKALAELARAYTGVGPEEFADG